MSACPQLDPPAYDPVMGKHALVIYLVTVGITSVIAFVAYGVDKNLSVRRRRRVSEKTLHLLALLGGWPGAWMGQRVFRHKTRKTSFRVGFACSVALHVLLVAGIFYWWTR